MAEMEPSQGGCTKCSEMQRLYLNSLDEKRDGLARLQEERDKTKKLEREVEKIKAKLNGGGREKAEENLTEAMHTNTRQDDFNESYEKEKCRLLREADQAKSKLALAESRIVALESEVMRLAISIAGIQKNLCEGSALGKSDHMNLVKQQLQVYKEDFTKERKDRERAQSEKECLQIQVQGAHDVIATLSQEIDLYKKEMKRNQEEKKLLMCRRHSAPVSCPSPQIQIVYPVVDPSQQQQWQWQQERRRRQGILTRGPMPTPPSVFYGGDVEIDH